MCPTHSPYLNNLQATTELKASLGPVRGVTVRTNKRINESTMMMTLMMMLMIVIFTVVVAIVVVL